MIRLTRFNESVFVLNAELIQTIEETPDTVITLVNGQKILVLEDSQKVIEKVVEYKRNIFTSHSLGEFSKEKEV
ncbi:flagellar FlbD family protein [Serpentinicella alkaliphila]|uniref:Flagellar protein FlbD n=1 Tax=Serpentinicella alkaliphila TaxID=1734049 RepID=A0A4V2T4M5_9FIRM|nr:flagellar FlbD family protein [Serpentinicella alkaliphila]QUH26284.1 flagellar FlbD family protein [Serpentinicella alkaliphila]TCQ05864.1 flagellar protein FlbD [Serpentinicella alkaliphila]